jgi:hypothetical protein
MSVESRRDRLRLLRTSFGSTDVKQTDARSTTVWVS